MTPFRPSPRLYFSMREIFSHVKPSPYPQVLHVQRVRVKPRPRWKPLSLWIVTSIVCWKTYDYAILSPLGRALREAAAELPEEEVKELDEPIFVPFPFTTREVRSQPYSSRDPEWQTFCTISKDKEAQTKVRKRLAELCLGAAQNTPGVTRRLGPKLELGTYWLELSYPFYPPNELRRKGLELNSAGLFWVEKPVDKATVERLDRVLWPTALAVSISKFSWALFKQYLGDAARMLGLSSHPSDPATQRAIESAAEMMRGREASKKIPSIKDAEAVPPNRQTPTGPVTDNPNKPTPLSAASEEALERRRPQDLYPYESMREQIKGPWQEFTNSWRQRWFAPRNLPPRGVVIVQGLVQVESDHGWATVDCFGFYDPRTKDYTDNVWLKLRSVKKKSQAALR